MALALANEVRPFHIYVGCLMPGDVATGFTGARDKSEKGAEVYANITKAVSAMEKDEQNGMRPEQMAGMHGLNENIEYDCLSGCVDFYKNIIREMK